MLDEEKILQEYRNVAVVGASNNPDRASYRVFQYLAERGYNVIPINPTLTELLGRKSYPSLETVPAPIEVVDIFRRAEDVMPIIEDAIKVGAKAVWMQQGIVNEAAATRAKAAGLMVVMDKCMRTEHALMVERSNWK